MLALIKTLHTYFRYLGPVQKRTCFMSAIATGNAIHALRYKINVLFCSVQQSSC